MDWADAVPVRKAAAKSASAAADLVSRDPIAIVIATSQNSID
jgi:hypothetical protein